MEINKRDSGFFSEGVRLMFLSTLAFSLANVFVKEVSHLPTMEIVFFRCLSGVVFCYIGLKRANADWRGSSRKILFLRGLFGTTALYLFFLTVQNIPLASAVTIQYLSPIFTTIIAIFILKETVKPLQWLFYAMAFSGVLFIEKFDARVSLLFLFLGIISAFCSGVAYNLVRSLREKEHPLTIVLHFQLFGLIFGFIFTLFNWKMPAGGDWLCLFLIGVFSQLGQVFLTNAFQKEKAASVAIVNYTGLIYALIIGWFVFGETQTVESLVGMSLVVIGVILSIIYGKRQRDIERIESTAG
ncbi:MAG: DMT family transporter [Acidobacteria bacterium]|nr:DMT family transporter [Acidobacteriota bacterium]MCA1636727.1 DMT family transporter [Acidobacteriota bacterium]